MIIWEVEKVSFGSRLKELRSERGISQKDVALNIGVAITTISQYENDSRFPTILGENGKKTGIFGKMEISFGKSLDFFQGME